MFDRPGPQDDYERYDTDQPWICWRYLTTDARTRITGRCIIQIDCCVCGEKKKLRIRIPRFGPVPIPEGGRHRERLLCMRDHLHPEKGHPMSWAKPLRNPFPQGGIDLDLLAMRLEADLRAAVVREGTQQP